MGSPTPRRQLIAVDPICAVFDAEVTVIQGAPSRQKVSAGSTLYRAFERGERHGRRGSGPHADARHLAFVLVPVVVLCCSGVVVGAPVLSVLRITLQAGRRCPGIARGPRSAP
jgi:hypothetical protein